MKLYKLLKVWIIFSIFTYNLAAQPVQKNIIVEHFTNTRCSVCANRNPGFYTALNQNLDIIHIAFHPSSPYSSCLFSMLNKSQNDERANFYEVFGGTPTFVINGEERSSSQVQSSTVYNEFKNQTTPIELKVNVYKFGLEEIEVAFEVTAKADNDIGNINYFIALVEDTIIYNAPNGENIHYDVFRKSFTNDIFPDFIAPQNEGNQFTFKDKIKLESFWNASRIYAVVILTDANKKVIQVAKSDLYNPVIISNTENELLKEENIIIFPNPTSSELSIQSKSNEMISKILIFNTTAQKVLHITTDVNQQNLDVSNLEKGIYFIQINTEKRVFIRKFLKT